MEYQITIEKINPKKEDEMWAKEEIILQLKKEGEIDLKAIFDAFNL